MNTAHADLNALNVNVKFLDNGRELYGLAEGYDDGADHELAYSTPFSAGVDLRACTEDEEIVIQAGGRYAFPAGISIEPLTPGIAAFIFSRSGLGTKEGLTVSQGVGVIDPDYRGQIIVSLLNTSGQTRTVRRGQRIAQMVFLPFYQANLMAAQELGDTDRGAGGFGHTGKM